MADTGDSEIAVLNEVLNSETAELQQNLDTEMTETNNTEAAADESKADESEVVEISLTEGDGTALLGEGDAETNVDEEVDAGEGTENVEAEMKGEEEAAADEDAEEEEEEEEDDEEAAKQARKYDPSVMPQVNVTMLTKRKWQVKVYPLKPRDFVSGQIARVFKNAKESLLYIIGPSKHTKGKGEMYISSVNQTIKVVQNLMKLDFQCPEINIQVVKKNDEGVIEEKAYMRFDSKMVRMLCVPSHPPGRRVGNKRERVIGSVFVKNLPNNTSKDMLRVMFPFAPEINYNPEKFKDGTARLVLNNRNAVVPCLKAFAKVELGGNILELHPLEKRKKTSESAELSSQSHEKTESDSRKKEETKKGEPWKESDGNSESERTQSESKPNEKEKIQKDAQKSEAKTDDAKEPSKKSPAPGKSGDDKATARKVQELKKRARNRGNYGRRGGFAGGQERKRLVDSVKKSDVPVAEGPRGSRSDQRRGSRDGGDGRGHRNHRNRQDRNRGNRSGGPGAAHDAKRRNDRDNNARRGGSIGGGVGGRNRLGSGGGFGRRNPGFDDRMMRSGFGTSATDVNADLATKEMMLLQSQLSMAIKNQLTMLNQTQMAVEQARRGAGGVGLAREGGRAGQYSMAQLAAEHSRRPAETSRDRHHGNRSRSRDRGAEVDSLGMMGAGYAYKRNADVAGFQDSYGGSSFGKRRNTGAGQQQESAHWAEERDAGLYGHQQQQQPFGYAMDRQVDDRAAEFENLNTRSFNHGNLHYGYQY